MNYKVIMAYDGSRYNGWQKQGNTDKTIQGKLGNLKGRFIKPYSYRVLP